MQEREELNKILLGPLFLHQKTHLPRCELRSKYLCLLDETSKFKVRQASEYVSE